MFQNPHYQLHVGTPPNGDTTKPYTYILPTPISDNLYHCVDDGTTWFPAYAGQYINKICFGLFADGYTTGFTEYFGADQTLQVTVSGKITFKHKSTNLLFNETPLNMVISSTDRTQMHWGTLVGLTVPLGIDLTGASQLYMQVDVNVKTNVIPDSLRRRLVMLNSGNTMVSNNSPIIFKI